MGDDPPERMNTLPPTKRGESSARNLMKSHTDWRLLTIRSRQNLRENVTHVWIAFGSYFLERLGPSCDKNDRDLFELFQLFGTERFDLHFDSQVGWNP